MHTCMCVCLFTSHPYNHHKVVIIPIFGYRKGSSKNVAS